MVETILHDTDLQRFPISLRRNVNAIKQRANLVILRCPYLLGVLIEVATVRILAVFEVVEAFAAFLGKRK